MSKYTKSDFKVGDRVKYQPEPVNRGRLVPVGTAGTVVRDIWHSPAMVRVKFDGWTAGSADNSEGVDPINLVKVEDDWIPEAEEKVRELRKAAQQATDAANGLEALIAFGKAFA